MTIITELVVIDNLAEATACPGQMERFHVHNNLRLVFGDRNLPAAISAPQKCLRSR